MVDPCPLDHAVRRLRQSQYLADEFEQQEGLRNGEYKVVDRWSPRNDAYARLCKYLLRAGKVDIEEKDLY
jgi:hypothetical protein